MPNSLPSKQLTDYAVERLRLFEAADTAKLGGLPVRGRQLKVGNVVELLVENQEENGTLYLVRPALTPGQPLSDTQPLEIWSPGLCVLQKNGGFNIQAVSIPVDPEAGYILKPGNVTGFSVPSARTAFIVSGQVQN